ncbi:protoporphyrinogen oxidase [Geobacter sulfurreducens]|jgi:oxygen-dependent protoporphyrinogen oxidase|uniref:Coproporphyrinogen III oxidase n=1 Tax=Geobacter sulfurreducens (strain ATCC 51573 / DSM 12127 / PCA) TaxID=243231 RepID=Q74H80_GEOSL|nr:protoporphyrinogen oxidase [Geobacter sulfurreducens]AAR33347.1 protoporphyrinogen oxidase [Geobacter sulfurreducens PCA]AJY69728.1 protoporphyrinogen oxidase [Geobacter sulfurreducens]UAC04125.1 protoporphyrinogen oxidase [Geobacter sulfurreducens]UTG92762.1 protoporphyrinogen oxidase [Geobacter sulfurreducens]HBB70144.1 protoporphyrinogen oxidase [Geobacter sulfurreducens]
MKKAIVAGGGISGLATAYLLKTRAAEEGLELDVTLVEREERLGGKIWSIKEEGYLCEWGPNGFLDSKPQTLDLCRELGASDLLLRSNDNARKRFIYTGGALNRLPENGPMFLKSGLISWPGKLRLAMEPFIPKKAGDEDETLAAFGRRRLGDEALRKLIAPMVSGIFAGNPETMSLRSCFPRIAELEDEYGSLVRAMIRLAKKKKQEVAQGKAVASAAGPGGVLTSFRDGIQALTDILAERLGPDTIVSGQEVLEVSRGGSLPWRVRTGSIDMDADLVILATPAYATASIIQGVDSDMAGILRQIPYATMTVVCFGYDRERIAHDLNGFGYLIPKEEGMNTLGTLWDSSIFENRAPEGQVLLRSMMGGACFPEYVNLTDEEVTGRVKNDLATIMGITAPPSFVRIFRHHQAIPQYTVGHSTRVAALEQRAASLPGLFLTGNSYRGIGLNDCVAAANRTAGEAIAQLTSR